MRSSLLDKATYDMWRLAVNRECSVDIPKKVEISCTLITKKKWKLTNEKYAQDLRKNNINAWPGEDFLASFLE